MNFKYIKNILPAAALALTAGLSSCVGDLDVTPIDPSTNMEVNEVALYTKCYANMALAGQEGAGSDCDIDDLDGGTTGFVRQLFNANELTTDESICGWGDDGILGFDYCTWDAAHPMLKGFYYRLYAGINYCNHYLDVCKDVDATRTAEVRFLRCLYYSYLLDCWGNVPFTLQLSATASHQIARADLFKWIEAELLGKEFKANALKDPSVEIVNREAGHAIIDGLLEAKARTSSDADYGRADKDAANLLLARLYLNAEVYTGQARWADAKEYAVKIIAAKKHTLWTKGTGKWSAYQMLFMGDNGENGASCEAILPLLQDGKTTTSWGTTLFLMASTWKADMNTESDYNTTEFWSGNRARPEFVAKFFPNGDAPDAILADMPSLAGDDRALIHGKDRQLHITKVTEFTHGYSVGKFRNSYTDGSAGHSSQFPDTDFFLMRAAEAYLIAAEADARLNGGVTKDCAEYINALRARANTTTQPQYSLDQILDERSRELYYEGFRRTDLIRYGYFGGAKSAEYVWEWKGGAEKGVSFPEYRNLFALPNEDVNSNPNLVQNNGYK